MWTVSSRPMLFFFHGDHGILAEKVCLSHGPQVGMKPKLYIYIICIYVIFVFIYIYIYISK